MLGRNEIGEIAKCDRVMVRKDLIDKEIMRCQSELRILGAQYVPLFDGDDGEGPTPISQPPVPIQKELSLFNRKVKTAVESLKHILITENNRTDSTLKAEIPFIIAYLEIIPNMCNDSLDKQDLEFIHVSFGNVSKSLTDISKKVPHLNTQLKDIIGILDTSKDYKDTNIIHWVRILDAVGNLLAIQTNPNQSVQLVATMGESILAQK